MPAHASACSAWPRQRTPAAPRRGWPACVMKTASWTSCRCWMPNARCWRPRTPWRRAVRIPPPAWWCSTRHWAAAGLLPPAVDDLHLAHEIVSRHLHALPAMNAVTPEEWCANAAPWREQLLSATAQASRLLLESSDVMSRMTEVLQLIGEAAEVDRTTLALVD